MTLRREHNCFTRVTDSGVEVWVSYKIGLPLEEPPGELIEEDGISYISFATPKARKQRVRKLRRELWRAARDLVKHYTRG
jgi:hypothetical protein